MYILFSHLLPLLLLAAATIEGMSYAFKLINAPSDLAVFVGCLLLLMSFSGFALYLVARYLSPFLKEIQHENDS